MAEGSGATALDWQSYAAVSALAAILSPVLIAIGGAMYDGTRWEQPLGLLAYAGLFVFPFTLVGSFVVLWPVHRLLARRTKQRALRGSILLIAGLVGGAMLCALRFNSTVFAIGALAGVCTAVVWLVALHMAGSALPRA